MATEGKAYTSQLQILYEMVNDPSSDSLISWSATGKSFIVWDKQEFSRIALPKCVFYTNYSQFTRVLDIHGFRKVEPSEQLEFEADDFVRGEPEGLKKIFKRILNSEKNHHVIKRAEERTKMRRIIMKKTKERNTTLTKKLADQMQHLLI